MCETSTRGELLPSFTEGSQGQAQSNIKLAIRDTPNDPSTRALGLTTSLLLRCSHPARLLQLLQFRRTHFVVQGPTAPSAPAITPENGLSRPYLQDICQDAAPGKTGECQ